MKSSSTLAADISGGAVDKIIVHAPYNSTLYMWYKKAGDVVNADEPVVAVDTDKLPLDVCAPQTGTILKTFGITGDYFEAGVPLFMLAPTTGPHPSPVA